MLSALYKLDSPQIYFTQIQIKKGLDDFHDRLAASISSLPQNTINNITLNKEARYIGIFRLLDNI